MKQIRKRLTYANVMSSIAVFLVIGGATAFAAAHLGKNSVGTKQLKKNAVTAAKIKANAVTTAKLKKAAVTNAKIKENAVDGSKIADGSITGPDINAPTTPFGRVVARMRGNSSLSLAESLQVYPLTPSTYSQSAEEVNSYVGAVDVTFPPSCTQPREATAFILVDSPNPTAPASEGEIASLGIVQDKGSGAVTKRIQIAPFFLAGIRFEPGATTSHTVNLVVSGECETGSGITATFGGVDVLGTK